jgi:hypothetical protein
VFPACLQSRNKVFRRHFSSLQEQPPLFDICAISNQNQKGRADTAVLEHGAAALEPEFSSPHSRSKTKFHTSRSAIEEPLNQRSMFHDTAAYMQFTICLRHRAGNTLLACPCKPADDHVVRTFRGQDQCECD